MVFVLLVSRSLTGQHFLCRCGSSLIPRSHPWISYWIREVHLCLYSNTAVLFFHDRVSYSKTRTDPPAGEWAKSMHAEERPLLKCLSRWVTNSQQVAGHCTLQASRGPLGSLLSWPPWGPSGHGALWPVLSPSYTLPHYLGGSRLS